MAEATLSLMSSSLFSMSRGATSSKLPLSGEVIIENDERQPFARPSATSKPPTGIEKVFKVAIFFLIIFLGACLFSCVAPFFPTKALEKGLSLSLIGLIMGSMGTVGFVACCVCAIVGFKIGIKFLMCAGMFVTGTCAVLFGVLDYCPPGASFAALSLVLRTVEGVGVAMYFYASYTMAAVFFIDDFAFIMGLLETSASVGTLFGPSLGGALYAAGGYVVPFAVLGGGLLLMVPFSIVTVPSSLIESIDPTAEEFQTWTVVKKMFTPATLITVYTMTTTTICWVFSETTLGVRLQDFDVTDPLVVGLLYLASSGPYSIAAPITGRIADRIGYAWLLMLIGTLLLVVGYLILGPTPLFLAQIIPAGLPQLIVGCVFNGLGMATVTVPTTKELQRQAELSGLNPNSISTLAFITSIFQSIWFIGGLVGSVISTSMMEYLGYGWATTIQAGILMSSVLLQCYTIFSHGIASQVLAKCKGYESLDDE